MSSETPNNDSVARVAADAPRGGRRRRILVVAAVVLVAQLIVPATYYVGESGADERFAWRMFSNRRAETCKVQAAEERVTDPVGRKRPLRLSKLIHRAWIHGLTRRRPDIVDRFFTWRCEDPEIRMISLSRRCRSATGEPLPLDVIEHRCQEAP